MKAFPPVAHFLSSNTSFRSEPAEMLYPAPRNARQCRNARQSRGRLPGRFVLRYRTRTKGTLMKLGEGAFLPCSFWLADYYKLAGRHQDAENVLKRLLAIRNDLGLLAEEYDVRSRQMIGNFPQALSHVALVNTIINLYSRRGPAHQRAGDQRKTPAC
jgi:GH15 family glucan-1,4-alpha-glucosidase